MFNETQLIQMLEIDLGYKFTDLEITHDEIMNIIRLKTLPEFSKYFPYQERIVLDSKKDLVPGYNNRYYLNTRGAVINVNRIVTTSASIDGGGWTGSALRPGYDFGAGNFFERQVMADLASTANPVTFMFYPPNQIEIAPGLVSGLVVVNTVHDDSLLTIPMNLTEQFSSLALADVKIALYKIRNRFNNMQTTYGSLELFIDDLQEGKQERTELLEQFRLSLIKTPRRRKLVIR